MTTPSAAAKNPDAAQPKIACPRDQDRERLPLLGNGRWAFGFSLPHLTSLSTWASMAGAVCPSASASLYCMPRVGPLRPSSSIEMWVRDTPDRSASLYCDNPSCFRAASKTTPYASSSSIWTPVRGKATWERRRRQHSKFGKRGFLIDMLIRSCGRKGQPRSRSGAAPSACQMASGVSEGLTVT